MAFYYLGLCLKQKALAFNHGPPSKGVLNTYIENSVFKVIVIKLISDSFYLSHFISTLKHSMGP